MSVNYYRSDIDGLRAIAVLGVILFHAGVGLEGGFVGVDVFLVISGYLITKIIVRESLGQGFSLKRFWVRRIRRILPASTVVTFATIATGFVVLDPSSYAELGRSVVAHAAMLANVFFWMSSGYFSEAAELQPLLHMWSLSVEEQFYLMYPMLLIIFLKDKRVLIGLLVCLMLLSLLVSSIGVYKSPSATFYLLPTRAWELCAGGLLALTESKFRMKGVLQEALALLGLFLLLLPMFIYSDLTPFPGMSAIAPVAGAVCLIMANNGQLTFVGRMLSNRVLVMVGLASYSLYLWHWPVLVFLNHAFAENTLSLKCGALVVTALLSFLSWRFIEIPFRSSHVLNSSKSVFLFWVGVTAGMIVLGGVVSKNNGLPSRFDSKLADIYEDVTWNGSDFSTDEPEGIRIGVSGEGVDFVVWGDSHAMALMEMIDSLASELGLSGAALLSTGRPPITNLWKPVKGPSRKSETTSINESRLNWILRTKVKDVILIARWQGMIEGLIDTEVDMRRGMPRNFSMVADSAEVVSPNSEQSVEAFRRQFGGMLQLLMENDVRVWVMLQVPSASRAEVARDFYLTCRFPLINRKSVVWDIRRSHYEEGRERIVDLISEFDDDVVVIDPADAFFGDNGTLRLSTDRALFRDEDHLTRTGAEYYLKALFEGVFERVALKD